MSIGIAYNPCKSCKEMDKCSICELTYFRKGYIKSPAADVVEVRHGQIKWVNRPISAQYATVTDEYGENHYGKVCDRIENNPVGYCGECGKRLDDTFMNYCPECGAKMNGDRREG